MGALIRADTNAPSARQINPLVDVLSNNPGHVDSIYVGQWSSASVPTARFRNASTSGKSFVAFAANASTEILACTNTGVTMAGTLTVTGALVANGGVTTTTLHATGAVDFDSTLNVDGATTTAAITASGVITANNTLVANAAFLANGAVTLGDNSSDALVVNATASFLAAATFSGTFATESTTTLGNAAGDAITVNGTTTFKEAVSIEVTAGGGNDQSLFLRHGSGDGAFSLGASNAADPVLIFKDNSGDQTFEVGNSSSTYQARILGAGNVTGSLTVAGGISAGASSAITGGLTVVSGGITITAGGLTVTSGGATLDAAPSTPAANVGYRESFAKGWVKFNTSGTILAELNVNSITDTGAGNWNVNWDRDFSSSDYACVATAQATWTGSDATTFNAQIHDATVTGAATQILVMRVSDGALTDPTAVHVAAFGTQ